MRKFTIFTLILTVVVIAVVVQIIAKDYLPTANLQITENSKSPLPEKLDLTQNLSTNVLGTENIQKNNLQNEPPVNKIAPSTSQNPMSLNNDNFLGENSGQGSPIKYDSKDLESQNLTTPQNSDQNTDSSKDFETANFVDMSQNVYLNEDQLKSAGFVNVSIEKEAHNGFLFKTVYIDDLKDVQVIKNAVMTQDAPILKVYIFKIGPLNSIEDVYGSLKKRASEGLDTEINETNEFGKASFYLNDSKRQETAFLVVRFKNLVYGFSYPKTYHPQVKNLVQLLAMEF